MQNSDTPTDWLTISEAAAELRAGPRTVASAIRRGELKAVRINGRDIRIARPWLGEWLRHRAGDAA